jgi:hypothetical protein
MNAIVHDVKESAAAQAEGITPLQNGPLAVLKDALPPGPSMEV